MEQINMCGFSELLMFAERNHGIFYNKAHDIFVRAEKYSGEIYVEDIKSELQDYRDQLSEDEVIAYEIIVEFAKHHNVDEFCIEPKNW